MKYREVGNPRIKNVIPPSGTLLRQKEYRSVYPLSTLDLLAYFNKL